MAIIDSRMVICYELQATSSSCPVMAVVMVVMVVEGVRIRAKQQCCQIPFPWWQQIMP